MNIDELKEGFLDAVTQAPFNPVLAESLLAKLRAAGSDLPFEEEEQLARDSDYDLLSYCCAFASLPALRWVIEKEIMGNAVDISLYTAASLADDLVSEENLRFLLQSYGVNLAEICFGDLDEDRKELVRSCLPDFDAEDGDEGVEDL